MYCALQQSGVRTFVKGGAEWYGGTVLIPFSFGFVFVSRGRSGHQVRRDFRRIELNRKHGRRGGMILSWAACDECSCLFSSGLTLFVIQGRISVLGPSALATWWVQMERQRQNDTGKWCSPVCWRSFWKISQVSIHSVCNLEQDKISVVRGNFPSFAACQDYYQLTINCRTTPNNWGFRTF